MSTANRNLLLLGLPSLLLLAAGTALFCMADTLLSESISLLDQTPAGELGDVEGYALLFGMFAAGFGSLAALALQIVAAAAMLYSGLILLLTISARILYRNTPGRILAYRLVMGTAFVVLVLPAPGLLQMGLETAQSGMIPWFPLFGLAVIAALTLLGCRNTYTNRIRDAGFSKN